MNLIEQLIDYKYDSVIVELNDDALRIKTNQSVLTTALTEQLQQQKSAIMAFYRQYQINSNLQLAPSSFSQQRVWFIDTMEGGTSNYNIIDVVHFDADVDVAAVKQALLAVIERQQSLRTSYIEIQGKVYQKVCSIEDIDMPVHHFAGTIFQQTKATRQVVANLGQYVFDFSDNLMIKVQLCVLSGTGAVLVVNIHHIASDGWSQEIFKGELLQAYQNEIHRKEGLLAPLEITFSDYARWERQYFSDDMLDKHLSYWQQTLDGLPSVHSLPLDRERPPVQTFNGNSYSSTFNHSSIQDFVRLCNEQGVSVFMGVSALFAYFLSRFSGEQDIAFAIPIANREQAQTAPIMGFFVNTLILRYQLDKVDTFEQLLALSKQVCSGAYAYQQVPFEQIVNRLKIKRSTSYSPAVQIMLSVDTDDTEQVAQNNQAEQVDFELPTTKFELSVSVVQNQQAQYIHWNYNSDIFTPSTVASMAACYEHLLTQVAQSPSASLSSLSLLAQSPTLAKAHITNGFKCAHQMFEHQVKVNPNAIALYANNERLSFAQLNQRANQLAHWLCQSGLKVNQSVVLYMEATVMLPVAVLAVLKAGCHFVIVDRQQPLQRLDTIIEQLTTRWLLSDTNINQIKQQFAQPINLVDSHIMAEINQAAVENPNIEVDAQALAYIAFTSGTTGVPKGVMITHQNLTAYLNGANQHYAIGSGDRLLQFSAVSFDIFVEELFCSICHGGALQLRAGADKTDAAQLIEYIKNNHTSVLTLPTAYFHLLCENSHLLANNGLDNLRLVIVGGEKLSIDSVKKWQQIFTHQVQLFNTYGPTETTVIATVYEVSADDNHLEDIPIGKPIDGLNCYIVDKFQQLCPQGMVGELFIAGDLVGAGYYQNELQTQQSFVVLPHITEQRMYKTGDLVKLGSDGQIYYLGRADSQVKVRGYRIELGEIEHQLNQHQGVDSTLVIAQKDSHDINRLVAYIKPSPESINSPEPLIFQLKQLINNSLPDYMMPNAFEVLLHWPLTTNGKIDIKALPKPNFVNLAAQYVAPSNELEVQLCAIWAEVLNIDKEQISVNADFFDLGGHSLLSVVLVGKIKLVLAISLSLKDIFQYQSIAALATAISNDALGAQVPSLQLIGADVVEKVIENSTEQVDSKTIYAVPGAAATAKDFLAIANALNLKGFNLKAFNHQGVLDHSVYFDTIEQNASAWVAQLLEHHQQGPVLLVGHSYGGAIALVMAEQLLAKGLQVKLYLLDVYFGQQSGQYAVNVNDSDVTKPSLADEGLPTNLVPLASQVKAVYDHQVNLFSQFKPQAITELKPYCVFAKYSAVDNEQYLRYLINIFQGGIEACQVEGDHFTMLQHQGAETIAQLIVKALL